MNAFQVRNCWLIMANGTVMRTYSYFKAEFVRGLQIEHICEKLLGKPDVFLEETLTKLHTKLCKKVTNNPNNRE